MIFISSSPKTSSSTFERIASEVAEIAQTSITKVTETRPLTILRANNILDFASKLDLDNEYERMVVIILSDISNEIILREKMKSLKIEGSPLDAGIPNKIKTIKEKGQDVYKKEEIKQVRELRNGIVHSGNIPDKNQAKKALEVAIDVLKNA